MHDIAMLIRCPARRCEIQPGDLALAECLVEELVSNVLTALFQVVVIEDVSLILPVSHTHTDPDAPIKLSLHAQGYDPLPKVPARLLDYIIEEHLSCALIELFGSLHVERFAVC